MKRLVWVALLTIVPAVGARAQSVASVREIARVVKVSRSGSSALTNATIGLTLGVGDRVRTGGRSAAGIRFQDNTLVRIGELSQLRINGARRSDAALENGELLVNARRPLRIQGSRAVAAVRGTVVHFTADPRRGEDVISCYDGQVFVSQIGNPITAGTVEKLDANSLIDPELRELLEDYTNGEIRFVEGPYAGQSRRVSRFDAAMGRVEWGVPLDEPRGEGATGYVLVQKADQPVVVLTRNTGTRVRNGAPEAPRRVPDREFARLDRHPYFRHMRDGMREYVYNSNPAIIREKERFWTEREGIRDLVSDANCGCFGRAGSPIPPVGMRRHLAHSFAHSVANARQTAQGGGDRGDTPAARGLPLLVGVPDDTEGLGGRGQFRLEPFGLASDEGEALGTRLRFQGVSGNTYGEVGYRYSLVNGHSKHRLSEAFVETRGPLGDLTLGRHHRFIGPANNSSVGTLLGFESVDGVVWELPAGRGFQQEVGYIWDTRAESGRGFSSGHLRGLAPLGAGNVGYSAQFPTVARRNPGWSLDIAQPLIRNTLDVYAEGGVDTVNRRIATAGFYVPYLYHRIGLDLFVEYGFRENIQERVSLRLRKEIADNLLLVGFVDRDLGTSYFTAGGGIMWSRRFR